jgi:hypothetical protein
VVANRKSIAGDDLFRLIVIAVGPRPFTLSIGG